MTRPKAESVRLTTSEPNDQRHSRFMQLPGEIRNRIYEWYFKQTTVVLRTHKDLQPEWHPLAGMHRGEYGYYESRLRKGREDLLDKDDVDWQSSFTALHLTCRTTYAEAILFMYSKPTFYLENAKMLQALIRKSPAQYLHCITALSIMYHVPSGRSDSLSLVARIRAWTKSLLSTAKSMPKLERLQLTVSAHDETYLSLDHLPILLSNTNASTVWMESEESLHDDIWATPLEAFRLHSNLKRVSAHVHTRFRTAAIETLLDTKLEACHDMIAEEHTVSTSLDDFARHAFVLPVLVNYGKYFAMQEVLKAYILKSDSHLLFTLARLRAETLVQRLYGENAIAVLAMCREDVCEIHIALCNASQDVAPSILFERALDKTTRRINYNGNVPPHTAETLSELQRICVRGAYPLLLDPSITFPPGFPPRDVETLNPMIDEILAMSSIPTP